MVVRSAGVMHHLLIRAFQLLPGQVMADMPTRGSCRINFKRLVPGWWCLACAIILFSGESHQQPQGNFERLPSQMPMRFLVRNAELNDIQIQMHPRSTFEHGRET